MMDQRRRRRQRRNSVFYRARTLPRIIKSGRDLVDAERCNSDPLLDILIIKGESRKKEEEKMEEEGLLIDAKQTSPRTPPSQRKKKEELIGETRSKSRRVKRKKRRGNLKFFIHLDEFSSSVISETTTSEDYIDPSWKCD